MYNANATATARASRLTKHVRDTYRRERRTQSRRALGRGAVAPHPPFHGAPPDRKPGRRSVSLKSLSAMRRLVRDTPPHRLRGSLAQHPQHGVQLFLEPPHPILQRSLCTLHEVDRAVA